MKGCTGAERFRRVVKECAGLWKVFQGVGGLYILEGCAGLYKKIFQGCGRLHRVVEGFSGLGKDVQVVRCLYKVFMGKVVQSCERLCRVVEGFAGMWKIVQCCE